MARSLLRPVLVVLAILLVLGVGLAATGLVRMPWSGGFSGGQRELTSAERDLLTASIESSLEGRTARFVWFPLREASGGVYCGLINTSNVVGDHSEDRLFQVTFAPTEERGLKSVGSVYLPGADNVWRQIIRSNCAKAGYVAAPVSTGSATSGAGPAGAVSTGTTATGTTAIGTTPTGTAAR